MRKNNGFSLVEMMIAIAIAMLLSVGVVYVYSGQVRTFFQIARKDQASSEAAAAFEAIKNLLKQADICLVASCATVQKVDLTYPAGSANPNSQSVLQISNDSLTATFEVPSGYNIWPNNVAPYNNNKITLTWSNTGPNAGIVFVQAGTQSIPIAGTTGSRMNTRIVNLDIWPQIPGAGGPVNAPSVADKPTAGYRITMTAVSEAPDSTYTNPLDPNGPLRNYRTVTYEAVILPRNW